MMLHALDLGLINGDYVFIDYFPYSDKVFFGDHDWQRVSGSFSLKLNYLFFVFVLFMLGSVNGIDFIFGK